MRKIEIVPVQDTSSCRSALSSSHCGSCSLGLGLHPTHTLPMFVSPPPPPPPPLVLVLVLLLLVLVLVLVLLLLLLLLLTLILARSTSEDMDAKIRKITEVFGLSADPDDNDAPSFPEMLKTMSELQQNAADCRDDIDFQKANIF